MIIFIILRILDCITTLLNINNWGWDIESNPVIRKVGEMGLFIPYQILITLGLVLLVKNFKYQKIVYAGLSILSLIAVLINSYCFLFIK